MRGSPMKPLSLFVASGIPAIPDLSRRPRTTRGPAYTARRVSSLCRAHLDRIVPTMHPVCPRKCETRRPERRLIFPGRLRVVEGRMAVQVSAI